MKKERVREIIAKRVARELKDGDLVNLGIGLPTLVANYIPEDINVIFQSENGFVGLDAAPEEGKEDKDIVNAGAQYATVKPDGAFFDSAVSFGMIRGGHVDVTVLGALQVDEMGNLASWMIPGKMVPGMGGAMDLVVGAKKVIIAMEHTAKGSVKILKKCTLPLTALGEVDIIITEMAFFERNENGLVLKELGPEATIEDVRKNTECDFSISEDLKVMDV